MLCYTLLGAFNKIKIVLLFSIKLHLTRFKFEGYFAVMVFERIILVSTLQQKEIT